MVEDTHLSVGLKICLIVGIIIVFILLISTRVNTVTVNMENIGLPADVIDGLKKLLGH